VDVLKGIISISISIFFWCVISALTFRFASLTGSFGPYGEAQFNFIDTIIAVASSLYIFFLLGVLSGHSFVIIIAGVLSGLFIKYWTPLSRIKNESHIIIGLVFGIIPVLIFVI